MSTQGGSDWPIVARDGEFAQAWAAFDSDTDFRGVALVGESGVGKSTLARALAESLEADGQTVRFVLGVETCRDVPLGAFSRSVTVDTAHEPGVMLAAAHQALGQHEKLVVVVDDAQSLDPLSATLVYQLAADRGARLIVTIRSGQPVSDAIAALLTQRLLAHLHVGPFTREQTGQLARAVLGADVDAGLIDDVYRRCGGNPLWLRALLRPGREAGVLAYADDGWRLHGALRPDRELLDLVEFRLNSLTPSAREAMEVLAVAEVLDWQILRELCDAEAVADLERRGLIQVVADGSDLMVQLNHPIFGEAAIELAGTLRCRQINGALAQTFHRYLEAGDRRSRLPDVRGWIRLAGFMIRSDLEPDLDVITWAAVNAAARLNFGRAEELARFAVDHGGGTPAAVELANTLGWRGRGGEAEAVFAKAAADIESADELEAVRWGCMRAANLFMGCGEIESARRLLAEVAERVESEPSAALVSAMTAAFAFFSDDPAPAIQTGPAVCASDVSPLAAVWAAVPTAHALARAGRFGEVAPIIEAGLAAATLTACGPLRFALGFAEVTALLGLGDQPAIDSIVGRYAEMAAASSEGSAMIDAMSGMIHQARGELPKASSAFQRAVSILSRGYRSAWVALVASWWAQVEGTCGNAAAAATALACAEHAFGSNAAVFEPDLELARAWERAAAGHTSASRAHALRAAQIARRSAMSSVEMWALHTVVRLGDDSVAPRLVDLARTVATPWAQATAAHARGLCYRDGDLLDVAADQFVAAGAAVLAADAAAQAAVEHARSSQQIKQLASSARAQRLAADSGSRTPAVTAAATPLPLTDRQGEIATLAARGLSNRDIAEQLCISPRTVDGHLSRIFCQLGIEGRDQLAGVLGSAGVAG